MKYKFLIYSLPVLLVAFLIFGYSTQDDPRNDSAPQVTTKISQPNNVTKLTLVSQSDTLVPAGFPPTLWNYNYATLPNGQSGGSVGASYFAGKYINNRWNLATLYRLNPDGQNGGPGTIADSNTAYNAGAGAIRDMTVAPDGSGTLYLWGGSASTALYKMDENGNRLASYTHTGAAYRTIAWDPNRKGFWSSNFSDNIVCRDTNGVVIKTLTNTLAGKYGMAFDSTSTADSAFLWVWSQSSVSGGPNELHRIHINSNTDTRTYLVPLVGGTLGIAGGAEAFVKDGKFILSLNYQNFAIVGYVLKELAPPPAGGSVEITRTQYRAIADNAGNANPAADTITISGIAGNVQITKVKLTINEVVHTWIGDLRFWLTKGSGVDTSISRVGWTGTGFGNSCNNFTGTILSDSAGLVNIQNIPTACDANGNAQATGNFNPKEPFTMFQNNGTNPNGSYILRISDNAAGDTGSLRSWTLKIDYDVITGVNNNITSIPNAFSLGQNYPNPFNPATKIAYTIPSNGLVTLKLYNILGKEVATLVNEVKSAGKYDVTFNGSSLSSGVYFYRLESGNFVDTKKMFLLK